MASPQSITSQLATRVSSSRRARFRYAFPCLAALILICVVRQARALEPTTPLSGLGRQSWVMEIGLPQNTVPALVQTRDGFLWLGTEVGLVRFDGNGFQLLDRNSKPRLPGNDVRCLAASKDGALWIGTDDGLSRLVAGAISNFTVANGLPSNSIRSVAEAADGVLWVRTDQGLVRFENGRFSDETPFSGSPSSAITGLISSGQGEVWIAAGETIAVYRDEHWVKQNIAPLPGGGVDFIQTGGDNLAISSKNTLQIYRSGAQLARLTVGRELPGSRIQALYRDREGSLWIGTNSGLARYAGGKIETLPVTDPLGSASVLTLMEDREGNLWAGTESSGLHILRDQRFHTIGVREGLSSDDTTAVVEGTHGDLWVGTSGSGLNVLQRNGKVATYSVRDGLLSDVILSLAVGHDGDMWVGTPDGLSRIRHDSNGRNGIDSFTSADGLPDDFIRSLLADNDGSLWIGTRRGLAHCTFKGSGKLVDSIKIYGQGNGLGSDLVGAMARDVNGDLWIATFAGLSRFQAGHITNYTTADGLSSNVITALLPRNHGELLAGTQDHGWNLWNGQHFTSVNQAELSKTTIHAILDDDRHHLWFATGDGIARCDCATTMQAMQTADCTNWIEFGTGDGLRSRETATNSHPSAWRSLDGHLWFATPKGLVGVDPAHFPVNAVPPPVAVERFAVDDVDQAIHPGGESVVPSGHNHFQFDYAGLSFVAPQKVRYRYKLDGFDHDWTDAGSRRTAYYTNIRPGHYTLRVQAANNDGLWNTAGAALQFELRPHFYQTLWFYIALFLVLVATVLLLLRLRLLRAEREFSAVLGERNRIAREIHDTLAQGYVGISVQLEVLSELLRHKKVEAAAKHLDTTREYVREGLADARQSIWALRSQDAGEATLPVRMRRLVEQAQGHGLDANFSIYGAYRQLSPGIERELLRIAQEAIHNVKKHAVAAHLFVQLEYGPREIALEVRDDGRGFAANSNASTSVSDGTPGHYGITGMRERAAAVGGTLEIDSEPGAGTTVRLRALAHKVTKEQA